MLISYLLRRARRRGKKERKNLRSSETAAPHAGSIKRTSFAIKSETRLQSDFRILLFQYCVFSNFVESEFRGFFAEFYGSSNWQVRHKKFHCLNFGHFLAVSQLWVLPSYWNWGKNTSPLSWRWGTCRSHFMASDSSVLVSSVKSSPHCQPMALLVLKMWYGISQGTGTPKKESKMMALSGLCKNGMPLDRAVAAKSESAK